MPVDLEKIKNEVRQSAILSPVEKAEWLQLLPDMTENQSTELQQILESAMTPEALQKFQSAGSSTVPSPSPNVTPVPKPTTSSEPKISLVNNRPKVNIEQKEITAHLESGGAAQTNPIVVKTMPTPAPVAPSELQKRVASIVEELEMKKQGKVESEPEPKSKLPEKEPEVIALKTTDDFAQIRAAHVHGSNFAAEMQKIYDSMVIIGKNLGIYDVVKKFEQSPLYKTYIEIGMELLNDPNPDREAAYTNVVKNMQARGLEVLSKDEFEKFADFRKKLEQIL